MAACVQCEASLPPRAQFCPRCGLPVEAEQSLAERKVATVLFADLVGSSELGDALDPERTRALLERFYDAMAEEITAAGGTVEKFAGDAVLAAFGAPVAQEDHAERALHCALAMQRRLEALFDGDLLLRIGINTGELVVGRPREASSFISGSSVNVAARLEQAAAGGEVLVGERTVSAVRGAFEFDRPQVAETKGKSGGIPCRRVLRALSFMRPRGVRGLHGSFVGREAELSLLSATYQRAVAAAEPHLVTIMGDAGVGKTRLVRELWARLADESPEPLRRTGRCLAYGQGITYWPIGEIVREQIGLSERDSSRTVRERLGDSEIIGLALGLDMGRSLHPIAARDALHEGLVAFFSELTADRPAAVLVEDLHWAEEPLLDLLELLSKNVRGPLLLLATSRPDVLDRRPNWGGGRRNTSLIWLDPLSSDEIGRMLGHVLGLDLPLALRDAIIRHSEGNPFFAEELIGMLVDQGVLKLTHDGWKVAGDRTDELEVPDSVQAVVAARIDLLPPAEKETLQSASVVGRVFWSGPVKELLGGSEPDFDLLEERDFIRRRPGSSISGEEEFVIKHALTREVAYGSLTRARRGRLHAGFAGWLERSAAGSDEFASLLAHHYAEAVRAEDADLAWAGEMRELKCLQEKAVLWLRRAAELAVSRCEIDDGLKLLHHAQLLASGDRERGELWREIGHANALRFDGEAFWDAMERSLEIDADRSSRAETFSELAFYTASRSGMWTTRPEWELVDSWIERALELAQQQSPARARALIARAFWDTERDQEAAEEAADLAERLGHLELQSFAFDARRISAFRRGDYGEARSWAERRMELLDQVSDPDHVAEIYESAISGFVVYGDFAEARRLAALHDEVVCKLTPHHRLHGVAYRVEVEDRAGNWEAIRELAPLAEKAVEANLETPCVLNGRALLVSAVSHLHLGNAEEARRLESKAADLGMKGYDAILGEPRLRLALVRGDLDEAERLLEESVSQRVVGTGRNWYHLPATATRLDVLAALGDRTRVEREAPPLVRPNTYLEPFALRSLAAVRRDSELFERAAAAFDTMGLDWHAKQTRSVSSKTTRA